MTGTGPDRTVLENGLVVVTAVERRAPLAAVLVLYRCGSRDEPPGRTGVAHLVEHMMFRGTAAFPGGAVDAATGRLGGINNAVTTPDYTAYYFVLPDGHWRDALVLEADRMAGCTLDGESLEMERRVAVEERKMLDDDPEAMLDEAVAALAYAEHPYRNPVIGLRADIESLTLEDVAAFYRTFYTPANAVLVVAGDVSHEDVVAHAEEAFGPLTSSRPPESSPAPDPVQRAPRRAVVRTSIRTREVVLAFRCPPAAAPDSAAVELLPALLATGRSSRLWRRLVAEESIAADVSAVRTLSRDPGLFTVSATLHPGVDIRRAEDAVLHELATMGRLGIADDELAKARNLVRVDLMLARETCLGLAGALGFWECLGGWEQGAEFEDAIGRAGPRAVIDALEEYLDADRRSTVWLLQG
jgi:zinc protease